MSDEICCAKSVGNLTFNEIRKICQKYAIGEEDCLINCPIFEVCCDYIYGMPKSWTDKDMEKEIKDDGGRTD